MLLWWRTILLPKIAQLQLLQFEAWHLLSGIKSIGAKQPCQGESGGRSDGNLGQRWQRVEVGADCWSRFRSVFETSSGRCCLVLIDLFLHVWITGCECSSPDAQCWLLRRMGKDLKVLTDEWSPVLALWWLEASTLCRALFRQRERDLRKAFRLFDKVIWVHAILFKGSK